MTVRAVSYGGGVQSNALLVLAAHHKIDYDLFLFANTGDDSEHPATLSYVRDVAMPYAREQGVTIEELSRIKRDGTPETLKGRIESGARTVPIPARMSTNGSPGNRTCTVDFKIKVIAKRLKELGATADDPATLALGISMDEYHRMRTSSGIPHETLTYPLIDLRLSRLDCIEIIKDAGLLVPPKSSCWFCPYHTLGRWRDMKINEPDLFAQAVEIENEINRRRVELGKDQVFLTSKLVPLADALADRPGQMNLFEMEESCSEVGYCMI